MSLARDAADAFDSDDEDRETLMGTALVVGEWLAEEGRPGRWDTVDAEALLQKMAFASEDETSAFLLALGGLVGHAAFQDQLQVPEARRILLQIEGLAKNPTISGFAARAAHTLRPGQD